MTAWILFRSLLAMLACYRLSRLIAYDHVFAWLRGSVKPDSTLGGFFSCPYCVGIWFAVPLAFLVMLNTQWALLVLLVFAIAGAQDMLESSLGEDR